MAAKWINASLIVLPVSFAAPISVVLAVDSVGKTFLLWSPTLTTDIQAQPADTWVAMLPPHP